MTSNPTRRTYDSLQAAYDHFNRDLFDGQLPPCLITVQRHKGAYGYFSGGRFASTADPHDIADEIALNPMHFAERTAEQTLSTLAHEMAHLWQHHFGKRPRKSYHDRQWAAKMREIGLLPTATGAPGGKETGQKVTHLIEEGGRFAVSCAAFLATHPAALYQDRAAEDDASRTARRKKAASKTKFTCPDCGANAWGRPDLHLLCGDCDARMEPDAPGDDDPATDAPRSGLRGEFGKTNSNAAPPAEQGRAARPVAGVPFVALPCENALC